MSRATAGPADDRDGVMLHAEQIGDLIALLGHLGDWLAHAGPAVRTELSTFMPTPAFASPSPVPAEQVLAELEGHTETLIRGLHAHRRDHPGEQHR